LSRLRARWPSFRALAQTPLAWNRTLRHVLYLASIVLAWHDTAWAQSPAELQAARETELPDLRLVDAQQVDSRMSSLGIRFGYLEKDVRPGDTGRYFCGGLSTDRSAAATPAVAAALARLPYESVRKLGLRFVILCGAAKEGERPIGGINVPPLNLLMLEVGPSLERTTLHELYHLAESRYNTLADADWDRQFAGYANGYVPDLLKGALGSGKPGFLTAYAETFPYEDRAVLFEALVFEPGNVLAQIRATGDSVLRRKVLYMEEKSARLLDVKLALGRL